MAKKQRPAVRRARAEIVRGKDFSVTKPPAHRQARRARDAQPRLPPHEPTPAAEIAVEQRNAQIKRRNALIIEAKFERRRRKKKKRASRATLRIAELTRLFFTRYRGQELPDDDSGRQDAWIMINHLAMLSSPELRVEDWLRRCASWLRDEAMIERVIAKPYQWRADTMAKILNVTDEERTRLKLWTIGAVDCTKEQREARRRERKRLAKQAKRQEAGAKPRADFLAQSLTHAKPWIDEGISRRTWYRRQMAQVRDQHILAPTGAELVPSVPAAPPSDAGSPAIYAMAVRHTPPRPTASSLTASAGDDGTMSSRTATTIDCTCTRVISAVGHASGSSTAHAVAIPLGCARIPVATLDEAFWVRAAIMAERGREVARLARRRA